MRRNVLVIGTRLEEYRERAAILSRAQLEVDRFPSARDALSLIQRVPFLLLLARYPLPDLEVEELVRAIRAPGAPCEHAALALLAARVDRDRAQRHVGRGVNRVLALEDAGPEFEAAVAELLDIAPRKASRVSVRLHVDALGGPEAVYCQSVNVSTTGMLVESDRRYAPGTLLDFQIRLTGDNRPCTGVGEIARLAQRDREQVLGFAVHFRSFAEDGRERLARFLAAQATVEKFTPE